MKKKLHVIGLCGKGTSAVAVLMQESGWEISGSDAGMYEPISSYLKRQNISCQTPYSASNIPDDVDMIMMGSSSTLDPEKNEEVARAIEMGIPIKSFAEILETLVRKTHNIVVAGSYGKSTTTSLLAHVLYESGRDPSYFIGAVPLNFKSSSHIGSGNEFVLEGDEYPHSSTDMTSKFMFMNAHTLIFTSGEHDHINKFPTIESYTETYKGLIRQMAENVDPLVVAGIHHPNVQEILSARDIRTVTYGSNNADYTWENAHYSEVTSFDLLRQDEVIVHLQTTLLGSHNIENIVAVSAIVLERGLVTPAQLQSAIRSFRGIVRRLDRKAASPLIPVYEGYGSSYTKAKTALTAIKLHFPDKKILAVFEPHTFGWRNRGNINWYHDVFEDADSVFIYQPPTHGSSSHDQLTYEEIIIEAQKNHPSVFVLDESTDVERMVEHVNRDTVVLMLSSADIGGLVEIIPELIARKFK